MGGVSHPARVRFLRMAETVDEEALYFLRQRLDGPAPDLADLFASL